MVGRMTICNMAIEAGGKSGIIAFDGKTADYCGPRAQRHWAVYQSDPDAEYVKTYEIDASQIVPTVSWPHLPSNTKPAADSRDIWVDQVVVGSCTNGRIEDLRVTAEVLKGRHVHPNVRLIVIPATQAIYRQAMSEGLFDIFLDAGAAISTPTCGPCLGGHMGILAAGERAVATTNRNFVGRMGDPTSEVYLASPAVAAATAVAGHIALPEDLA
jgi:3-isopropylmalate/(R)-2-methylmalate dehydratase large subunit